MKFQLSTLLIALLTNHVTNGSEGICPENWTHWQGGCYRFYNTPELSWHDANEHCREIKLSSPVCPNKPAHLVTIGSVEENQFVLELWRSLRSPSSGSPLRVWIGLNDIEEEGNYVWIDGSPLDYENWTPGLPDQWSPEQDCGEMWNTFNNLDVGYWNDYICSKHHAFMCEFRCC